MPAKKKTTTRKKATRKSAVKKKTATKAPAKKAQVKAAIPPEKAAEEKSAIEERMMGPLADLEKIASKFRRMPMGNFPMGNFPMGNFDISRFTGLPSLFEGRMQAQFPNIDVVNREKEIIVRAEVPGFAKEDIEISLIDRTLTIKGESHHEEETDEGDLHTHEIRKGSFSRMVTLPEDVDGRKAKSSYKDGMVELKFPKPRQAKKHSITLE